MMDGDHNLERGQTTAFVGDRQRLFWFNNKARRKLEELSGTGLAALANPDNIGFTFVTNLLRAGLINSDEGMPTEDEADEMIDDLVGDDDPLIAEGLGESFSTLSKKLGGALGESLSKATGKEEKKDAGDKGKGSEDPKPGTNK